MCVDTFVMRREMFRLTGCDPEQRHPWHDRAVRIRAGGFGRVPGLLSTQDRLPELTPHGTGQ